MKSQTLKHGPRWLLLALPAAAVTAASLWTLVSVTLEAAAGSAPGDLLYPAREQALHLQLDLTTDPAERAALEHALSHLDAADTQGRRNTAPATLPAPFAAGRAGGSTGSTTPDRGDASRESGHGAHPVAHLENADDGAKAEDQPAAIPTLPSGGGHEGDDLAQGGDGVDNRVVAETNDDDQDTDDSNDDAQAGADGDLEEADRGDDDLDEED